MRIFRNTGLRSVKNAVLTLGNFDGLHAGHMRIIRKVVERAASLGAPSAVFTFDPHPLKVVAPEKSPPLLMDAEDKRRLLKEAGVDFVVFARFTKGFAATHPREFVEGTLAGRLSVKEVWVGHDFSFGKGRTGTVGYLKELGEELGFRVFVVPAYSKRGAIVSSSRIRALVTEGRASEAARLLGRPYSIKGRVVRGKSKGAEMGFPTANLKVKSELIPGDGVYAAYAVIDGQRLLSVVNIGMAPTLGAKERTVEVHIMDFKDNLYGRSMEVAFVRRIRGERRFRTVGSLVKRIEKDIKQAEKIL